MSGLGSRLLLPVLVALFALVGAASTAGGATAPQARAATSFEASVLGEINALRARHQLAPLRMNDRLAAAAGAHSQAMARQGFFRHESADGSSFWKRVQRFYGSRGYGYWSVGENLLWSSPSIDAAGALSMWLKSPPHRKNLLSPQWREIGLSAVHVASAPGTFNGLEVTIVTADFGVRR